MELWTAFTIGLVGSLHCVGMCGPIALALPTGDKSWFSILSGRFLYNLGRVLTYSIMGALFGLLGDRVILHGLQQDLSIVTGIIILVSVLLPLTMKVKFADNFIYKKFISIITKGFSRLSKLNTLGGFLLIGLLNGLLPCGLVYVGIAGAITTGSFLNGALYMALFGIGTIPVMFVTSVLGRYINLNIRKKLNKLIPVFAIILAVIFILRGLNLGIPFISPQFKNQSTQVEMNCH